jgi:hypothetical protein
MRFFNRLLVPLSLFVAMLTGIAAFAQTTTAVSSPSEDEDLRQTVRELALRVSALEEELHKQRAGTAVESASLKPATLAVPRVDVRSSVESVSSSDVMDGASAPGTATKTEAGQTATTQNAPVASALPTQLPGGATLNYAFDGYYDYDFNHPIGRVQFLRAYDVLSNAFSINQADVVLALDPDVAAGR